MSNVVISVENLSKAYRLGQIGTGTLSHDINVWWAKVRGKPNPMLRIGDKNNGNRDGETIWALKDVNFTVEQGEVLGIIGRNGAGKSTVLKILSRVTAPTSGHVHIKGRVASLLEVGTGFHPDLTGRENVFLNGAILGMSRKEITGKLDEIVDFSEIEKFVDTPVKRYSSGMYVRLAFAVAAHLDPEILLVDEVLAVGDLAFQEKCLGKMGQVATGGRSIIFISHNLNSIQNLCNKCILLERGMTVLKDTTENVITEYVRRLETVRGDKNIQLNGSIVSLFEIQLIQNQSHTSNTFFVGDSLQINALLHLSEIIKSPYLGIAIRDERYNLLFAFHSRESGIVINERISGNLALQFDIPVLNLLPGNYYISLVVVSEIGEKLLDIPIVQKINILPKDFSGQGYSFNRDHGVMIIPFKLKVTWNEKKWENNILC